MGKISISEVLKARRRFRILTVLACLAVVFFFAQLILNEGKKQTLAATGTGTADDPIIITQTGFIWQNKFCPSASSSDPKYIGYSGTDLTYNCTDGGTNYEVDLTNKYVTIQQAATPIIVTLWGNLNVSGLTVNYGATLTHAPIVWMAASGSVNYWPSTPGYRVVSNQEKDYTLGGDGHSILNAIGLLKKINIVATDYIKVNNGAIISAEGKGYSTSDSASDFGYPSKAGGGGIPGYGTVSVWPYHYAWGGGGSSHVALGGAAGLWSGSTFSVSAHTNSEMVSDDNGAGGAVGCNDTTCLASVDADHSNGGGTISLSGPKIYLGSTAKVSANGQPGLQSVSYHMPAGGGGGGSVMINATNTLYLWPELTTDPNVSAGAAIPILHTSNPEYNHSFPGGRGVYNGPLNVHVGSLISAAGGDSGMSRWSVFDGSGAGSGGGGSVTVAAVNTDVYCMIGTGIDYIPAACEGKDVIIDGQGNNLDVYADTIKVLQNEEFLGRTVCTDPANTLCDSKRKFNTLTLRNRANLTHAGLSVSELPAVDASVLNLPASSARFKKVDIQLTGNLIIESSSKIDVSGRGYPGGTNYQRGYGPGGGAGSANQYGTGGAYGGNGGQGSGYAGGIAYGDPGSPLDFGSGGGQGYYPSGSAGAGGGRIFITANNISMSSGCGIFANGANGADTVYSGSGAGGTIVLRLTSTQISAWIEANPGAAYAGHSGTGGTVTLKKVAILGDIAAGNIAADGASTGLVTYAGSGGGGRILLRTTDLDFIPQVKKTLYPIERAGKADTRFNPYTLQKGDIIKVELTIDNIEEPISITDDPLRVAGSTDRCVTIPSSFIGDAAPVDPDTTGTIQWDSLSGPVATLSYQCQVN